jgi:glucan 1,4-alpha-glucosidase
MRSILLTFLLTMNVISSAPAQTVSSPNGQLVLTFQLNAQQAPRYALSYKGAPVVKESALGIALTDAPGLREGFAIASIKTASFDETWNPVWGEVKSIRNHYKELLVNLRQDLAAADAKQKPQSRLLALRFRVFDDGVGFRYELPEQADLKAFVVKSEHTEFNLTGDHKTFWIPGDYDSQEYRQHVSKLSEIDAYKAEPVDDIAFNAKFAESGVQTPLMMKSKEGIYINIHEAALVNYPAMHLLVDRKLFGLTAQLTPNAVGSAAFMQTPALTPWRTIIVTDKATDILASKLILNLNEPSKISETSWIKPHKMIGVWWELHVGKSSWSYSDASNTSLRGTDWNALKPNGRHGATTENVKRYIDFAAKHGIDGVLVEGWNIGWEDWFGNWKEDVFDFVTPYPDFDVKALQHYAASKNVKLIMHHETSASVTNYERRMDTAFRFMKQHGYDTVKTGYVGRIIPRGEHHDGQWMVNHYTHVLENAAQHQIMVDSHESVRPTGLHRSYPNWLAAEAARGNEFNAWSAGNPPEHETILPFTRLMGGPMDYTPGIFEIKLNAYNPKSTHRVHTTLAKQLALYVTMYSPLQMAADVPENYEKRLDAFQFIKDVAVDWDDTRYIAAEPGEHITIARKAKGKPDWFIGAITNASARLSAVPLDFLDTNRRYIATVYADATDAHWDTNPMAYTVKRFEVNPTTVLKLQLAAGGGAAISVRAATEAELTGIAKY